MRLAASFCAFAVLLGSGVAAAQPAPITYAGQGERQTATLSAGLAGGADNSYDYGAQRSRSRAAVIDIRRGGAQQTRQATQHVAALAPARVEAPRAEQAAAEAPQWLERERVGPPYEANRRWYVPTPEPGYEQVGQASWYGPTFHGQRTASGEVFDQEALTAAHPTLPIPSLVQVTNLENGREVIVRVNDRGPFVGERLIDMSHGAAQALGFEQAGQARVHVRYLGPAPRRVNSDGSDMAAAAAPQPAPVVSQTAPMQMAAVTEGPVSLLPPETDADDVAAPQAPMLQQASYSPPAPAQGGYVVQIGAYSDLTNAHRVRDAVSAAGPVTVDIRQTSAGELFRVRVGPWASRAEADAAKRSLSGLGYPDAVVAAR